jgi:hypothetical protein
MAGDESHERTLGGPLQPATQGQCLWSHLPRHYTANVVVLTGDYRRSKAYHPLLRKRQLSAVRLPRALDDASPQMHLCSYPNDNFTYANSRISNYQHLFCGSIIHRCNETRLSWSTQQALFPLTDARQKAVRSSSPATASTKRRVIVELIASRLKSG